MLLVKHVLIVEIQDVHHHAVCLGGRTLWVEVHGIAVVIQRQLPVSLFAVRIAAQVESLVAVR